MDCSDARAHLHDLRRDRLAPELEQPVRQHLLDCPACARGEAAEAALDAVLHERLPRHAAPAALRERLERQVAWSPAPRASPPRRWARLAAPALAASLALLSGALLLDRSARHAPDDGAALVSEAVNDHLRVLVSQRPLEVASGGSHQVKPWFEGKLDFAPVVPAPDVPDLRLEGGAVGYFRDRKAAVAVYALRRHALTLLAFRAEGLPWPDGDRMLGSVAGRTGSERGFNVVLWRAGDLGYALVSDVGAEELTALAAAFAPATAR